MTETVNLRVTNETLNRMRDDGLANMCVSLAVKDTFSIHTNDATSLTLTIDQSDEQVERLVKSGIFEIAAV